MEVLGMAGGKFEMNIPGETRGGMGGGGEAALGAVMGELLRAVLRAKDRVVRFKPMLQELQSTLESIIPKISEIDRLNQQLDDSQKGDIIKLRVALEKAQILVEKCERRLLELLEKESLRQKLQKLDHALLRLCQIELQVEQLRDARMVLVEVRQLYQKLDSLDRKMNWRVMTCTTISAT
ncbi:LOW QUALITY PROTEIN: uncharacterized protein LOC116803646 [Vitis vinifera]|uniref:LOW QUALITY PROTEIN: uncharacterized protein LOC116803646 n=1 Tax=Vitis vinifera TaxID=29760 RepID=UPI0028832FF9|nr:LOW QUALITY PROTEIN: uncharacterized protein LOC116803646 [Vitis vinifera]